MLFCIRGHEQTPQNVKVRKHSNCCRICLLMNDRKYREKKKQARPPKTHCSNGHELSPQNIKIKNNKKYCRTCMAINDKKYREKNKKTRRIRTHCSKGHELSAQNVIVKNDGRRCRICLKNNKSIWSRKKYESDPKFRAKVKERVFKHRKLKGLLITKAGLGEIFNSRLEQNDLYLLVNEYIPKKLNPVLRDDVIQSTILALLTGEVSKGEIMPAIKKLITAEYNGYDFTSEHSKVMSLDVAAFENEKISFHEINNRNIWDM